MNELTEELNLDNKKFNVTRETLALFMGYRAGKIPSSVVVACENFMQLLPGKVKPRAGFRIFKNIKTGTGGFFCEKLFFKTEKIIARNFRQAEYLAFFTATAGLELDIWSRQAFAAGEGLLGYSIDCGGSIIAEELADHLEKHLEELAQQKGYSISHRYSPGYCGWDIREQKKLFSLLPAGFCGIHLTDSALMIPIKSVSGVIGIGHNIVKKDYQCEICNQENCFKTRLRNQPNGKSGDGKID